jgi:HD superfamily phosphohydrolase
MTGFRPQRVRDPLHNLIELGADQLEHTLWQVIQTPTFQRLRRIRQLGFSEFVFPGATHTRFAHSLGVFHTARQLMRVIRRHIDQDPCRQYRQHQAEVALAAALVHDVGHGLFSHAFETVSKALELPLDRHEPVSARLILETEIAEPLRELGSGFAADVATVVGRGKPGNLYDAVVASQFDADRLDYMQRDRLMTGVESSGVDATWLLANLEVWPVPIGTDEVPAGSIETLVLGPKAFHAAESYVLSLFHLYPNVYFHKATRAAEKVFARLFERLVVLVREGSTDHTGLPGTHPIVRFAQTPDSLDRYIALDDAVFWGAIPMMLEARDALVAEYAGRLWHRKLPKCIDVRRFFEEALPAVAQDDHSGRIARRDKLLSLCQRTIEQMRARTSDAPTVFVDQAYREPYKKDLGGPQSLLNQIRIRMHGKQTTDMAELSSVVAGAERFEVCRVYITEGDSESGTVLWNIMRTTAEEKADGDR